MLVGQPELRSSLSLPQMRQVDQRVSVRCELTALDADGVAGYVNHRLFVAGRGESGVEFTPAALEALYHGSAGVPRVINRLCDRALERGYAARTRRIDSEFVWDAIAALGPAPGIHDRQTAETPAAKRPIVQPPAQVPPLEPVTIAGTQIEASSPLLEEFSSEAELPLARPAPASIARSPTRQRWTTVAVASVLAVIASVGVYPPGICTLKW